MNNHFRATCNLVLAVAARAERDARACRKDPARAARLKRDAARLRHGVLDLILGEMAAREEATNAHV